ncbi:MAG TPA: YHS domain-containing protein [Nitrospirota bacterium]|nr:YHS domain-containing protein [Nitrospirota bacterium]
MKKLIYATAASLLFAVSPVMADMAKDCPEHAKNPDYRTGKVARDPVSGMEVKTSAAKNVFEYKGKKYFFCTPENLKKFEAAPEKYLEKAE